MAQAQDTASRLQARPIRVATAAPPASLQTMLLIIALVLATLYVGSDLLVPLALAVLLSFVLSPIVNRLERWRLGRIPSVIAVMMLFCLVIAGFGGVVGSQIADLANNLPTYERNIREKIRSVQGTAGAANHSVFQQMSRMFRDLRQEIEQPSGQRDQPPADAGSGPGSGLRAGAGPAPAAAPAPPPPEPLTVRVQEPDARPVEVVREVLGPVLAPVATAGMVLVFTIFMLLQREDLRDRLIRLVGSNDLSRTTEAMNDAAQRVSRYLLMQVVINVTYGLPIGLGLWLIGVPNPILWGMLATVLRFIPFAGPAIAASFPIMLSFAVAPGWSMPLLAIALFLVAELFSNNVLEPWLYGSATGLSSVAIIVAAVFWTTLWGPVGLLLATPLTVCLVVLGRHVPQLHFLEVMLGDRPVLPEEAKVYQRLLSNDPIEAASTVERAMEEGVEMPALFDGILLPALSLAEQDRQRGTLAADGRRSVAEGMAALVTELSDLGRPAEAADTDKPPPAILCVGGRNNLDEAAAGLLGELLRRAGVQAEILTSERVSPRNVAALGRDGVSAIVLSYLDPSALPHARRLVRRLRLHFGAQVPILLGIWSAQPAADAVERATAETAAERVATNLTGALAELRDLGILAVERPAVAKSA